MTRRLAPAVLIVGLLTGASAEAVADSPITIPMPLLHFTFNTHFAPVKLPKGRRAGIRGGFEAKVSMENGSHPPALEELVIELDKNMAIDAAGLPTCRHRPLEDDNSQGAERDCKDALVGTGQAEFEVAFPEEPPSRAPGEVLAFNAGGTNGRPRLLLHAYLAAPVSAVVVIPVEVHRANRGRFGLEAVAKVPKVAGGYASITSFSLHLGRKFTYKGKQQSYLLAKCPDGHLQANGVGVFADGTRISGTAVRSCVGERSSGDANRAGRSGQLAPEGSVPRLRGGAHRVAASAG